MGIAFLDSINDRDRFITASQLLCLHPRQSGYLFFYPSKIVDRAILDVDHDELRNIVGVLALEHFFNLGKWASIVLIASLNSLWL